MALPNLVLAGFPKCGTTSVAETLVRHPDVCGSFPHLRTRYFTPVLYDSAAVLPPIEDYERHYAHCRSERVRLDDTAVWMYGGQPVAQRVRDVLGDVKVLVMLREPVSRTSSYLAWKKRHGEIAQDMDLAEYSRRCEDLGPRAVSTAALNPFSGLHGSEYARYMPPWLDSFGDTLRIGYLDDLKTEPVSFYRALAEWIGITPSYFTDDTLQVSNTAKAVRSPRAERVIRRIGRASQPLAQRTPGLYRALRDGARRANMTELTTPQCSDAETRERLHAWFTPSRVALAQLVPGHELVGSPGWLTAG